jgi:DNA-binding transcriptional regulator YdaS (Cro superfamily)
MTPQEAKDLHSAWLARHRFWCEQSHGNQNRLARALGIDRRRVSQWFGPRRQSVPAWAVASLSKLTGIVHHTDHIKPLPPI